MVRANAGRDGELQFLGLGEALGAQVTGVEAMREVVLVMWEVCKACLGRIRAAWRKSSHVRSGNNDLGVNELLVEGGVLAVLV